MPGLYLESDVGSKRAIIYRFRLSNDMFTAGLQIRDAFDLIRATGALNTTDILKVEGDAHFGFLTALDILDCQYDGYDARWYSDVMIDGTYQQTLAELIAETEPREVKANTTSGFNLGAYAVFNNFKFGGICHHAFEDGGLIGWTGGFADPAEVTFNNCDIDASQGHDWGIYSWENVRRDITINGGTHRYCRQLVSAAGSGGGADQRVKINGAKCYGDANGSTSLGTSSEMRDSEGVDKFGVLTPVVNRLGTTELIDVFSEVRGLTEAYSSSFGCPRLVALCTNQYNLSPGANTATTVTRCRTSVIPGNAIQTSDVDLRGTVVNHTLTVNYDTEKVRIATQSRNVRAIIQARGMQGSGGECRLVRSATE